MLSSPLYIYDKYGAIYILTAYGVAAQLIYTLNLSFFTAMYKNVYIYTYLYIHMYASKDL